MRAPIVPPAPAGADGSMRRRLTRLSSLEKDHFWFVGRRTLVGRMLERNGVERDGLVADLGCGTGSLGAWLAGRGFRSVGVDLFLEGLSGALRVDGGRFLQADVSGLPFVARPFRGVVMLDVLEHVDDRRVLTEVRRILEPGGWLLVTVPALPWLWSHRDVAAGHLRRYTRPQLLRRLEEARFRPQDVRYYQFLLSHVAILVRVLLRNRERLLELEEKRDGSLNQVFTFVNRKESEVGDRIKWPWGSSLAVLCRKA